MTSISIIGLGYVGLCAALFFTDHKFKVIGVDVDQTKINRLSTNIIDFFEPHLDKILTRSNGNNSITFTSDTSHAIKQTEVSFISVGTPSTEDGSIDLTQILNASKNIGQALGSKNQYHLIIVKSTVLPGTTSKIIEVIEEHSGKKCGTDFGVCVNPEFLREGNAYQDIQNPDRVLIGEYDKKSGDLLEELYTQIYGKEYPNIIRTNTVNAELIKYTNNAFLAQKISFINTIANICNKTPPSDVGVVAHAIGLDHRISPAFLRAGIGYGGSCFKKDIQALIKFGESLKVDTDLLDSIERVNNQQPRQAIKLAESLIGSLEGKIVSVLGLAFKPNTDDMRNAVSIPLIKDLTLKNAQVKVYDPVAMENAKQFFGTSVQYSKSMNECLTGSDCCILVTEWDEFKSITSTKLKSLMRIPAIVDGRKLLNPNQFNEKNVKFTAIGLGV